MPFDPVRQSGIGDDRRYTTLDVANQVDSPSSYRGYTTRDAAERSSGNVELIIGMGGEPSVTAYQTPEMSSQEPRDNGHYLGDWNIQPGQRRYSTAAGRYARETMGEDRYQSAM